MSDKLDFTDEEIGGAAMMEEQVEECIDNMAKVLFKTLDIFMKSDEVSEEMNKTWTLALYQYLSENTRVFSENGLLPGISIEEFYDLFNLQKTKEIYQTLIHVFKLEDALKYHRWGERADGLFLETSFKASEKRIKKYRNDSGDDYKHTDNFDN